MGPGRAEVATILEVAVTQPALEHPEARLAQARGIRHTWAAAEGWVPASPLGLVALGASAQAISALVVVLVTARLQAATAWPAA